MRLSSRYTLVGFIALAAVAVIAVVDHSEITPVTSGGGVGLEVGVGAGASVDVEYIQSKRIRRGQVISAVGALGD